MPLGTNIIASIGLSAVLVFLVFSAPPACGYPGVIVTRTNSFFNGSGVSIDSFDSNDPNHSDWQTVWNVRGQSYGLYPANPMALSITTNGAGPEYKRKANALVGSADTTLTLQNVDIAGYISTAPGGSAIEVGTTYVGDVAWVFATNGLSPGNATQAVEPGHSLTDMPVAFPDVHLPQTNWLFVAESGNKRVITTFTNSGYYQLSGSGGAPGAVNRGIYIKGTDINIWLPYGLNYTGNTNGQIYLETNSDVTFYVDGTFVSGIRRFINNAGNYAPACRIYGLPDCSAVNLGTAGPLACWIYTPSAFLAMGTDGGTNYDFIGALLTFQMNFGGRFNFHYDEALAPYFPTVVATVPTNYLTAAGSNVTFSVSMAGVAPVRFQWLFNQTNLLAGATNATLTRTNVQVADSGNYSVVTFNLSGLYVPQTNCVADLVVYTNAAATLVLNPSATGVQLTVQGIGGIEYVLQTSTNLTDWKTISSGAPPYDFTDTNAQTFPQSYYRAICWPH